jgi:hypothetical protein
MRDADGSGRDRRLRGRVEPHQRKILADIRCVLDRDAEFLDAPNIYLRESISNLRKTG